MLDLARVRAQFLARARDFVFCDNAGGAQILGRAVDAIVELLTTQAVRPASGGAVWQSGAPAAAAGSVRLVRAVDAHAIGIKHGDFYARRLVDRLGLGARGGVVRASLVHYNTLDEVERLCAALAPILKPARAG